MNIIVINKNAGSLKHGMEIRPYEFAREWVKAGHKVTIVAVSYVHYRQQNIECTELTKENIDGIDYVWLPTPKYIANDERRLANIQTFANQLELNKEYFVNLEPDIVIDSSSSPLNTYCCYDIAKQCRARYVVMLRDLWELIPIELPNMSAYNAMMREAEYYRCSKADTIITALPKLNVYLESYGLEFKKTWFIPNGVSLSNHDNGIDLDKTVMAKLNDYKADGKLLIGYAGTLDAEKALNVLIDAAKSAPANLQFVILGAGQEQDNLIELAKGYDLNNVTFLGAVPKAMVPSFLEAMDWLYAGWQKNDIYHYGVSNSKITEYMFASKPILHSISADNDLVQQSGCGISVPAEDVDALVDALGKVATMSEVKCQELGSKGREYVTRQLDYRALANWFLEVCRM